MTVENGWTLAIDFGTTATAAAVGWASTEGAPTGALKVRALEFPDTTMPSSVYADGRDLLAGRLADNMAAEDWGAYERAPKDRVDERTIRLGNEDFTPVQLIAAVITPVIVEAVEQHDNTHPDRLIMTHPVDWQKARQRLLTDAVAVAWSELGGKFLPEPELMSEPVAAAHWFASKNPSEPGDFLAVYDLGGGTFDTTVLRATEGGGFDEVSSGGIDTIGGLEFDRELFFFLGERHIATADSGLWAALADPKTDDPAVQSQRWRLQTQITYMRERLSTKPEITSKLPGVSGPVTIRQDDFQSLIVGHVDDTIAELSESIARAKLQPEAIKTIYRIGGAARTPLVKHKLDELRRPVRVEDHPKLVVALGAAMTPTKAAEHPERGFEVPKTPGRNGDNAAHLACRRAAAASATNDLTSAVILYQQAIDLADPQWSAEAARSLAALPSNAKLTARCAVAETLALFGDHLNACVELADIVSGSVAEFGLEHTFTLSCRRRLAMYRMLTGETARAAKDFAEIATIARQHSDPWARIDDFYQIRCTKNAPVDDEHLLRLSEAAQQTESEHFKRYGPDDERTTRAHLAAAEIFELRQSYVSAAGCYEAVLNTYSARLGPGHIETLMMQLWMAVSQRDARKDPSAAGRRLGSAVSGLVNARGADDLNTVYARIQLAASDGREHGAPCDAPEWPTILEELRATRGSDHPATLYALHTHAVSLLDANRRDEAIDELQVVVRGRTATLGERNACTLESRWRLAVAVGQSGDAARAAVELKRTAADLRGRPVMVPRRNNGFKSSYVAQDLDAWWKKSTLAARLRYIKQHGTRTPGASALSEALAHF
jgi:hypothetical protein